MPAAPPFSTAVLEGAMVASVQRVFKTTVSKDIVLVTDRSLTGEGLNPASSVDREMMVGSVGFVGAINGIVYLTMTADFAEMTTGLVLGMSLPEVRAEGPDVVKDAIGEFTNMTVGGFKNKLCDLGFRCMLTLPTLLRGKNIAIATLKSGTRERFHFDCEGHLLVADVQVKLE